MPDITRFILYSSFENKWLSFTDPVKIETANKPEQVLAVLKNVDKHIDEGNWVAGFITYEAASGIDGLFATHELKNFPLLLFAVFHKPEIISLDFSDSKKKEKLNWQLSETLKSYTQKIKTIKQFIEKGDTYQVNLTYKHRTSFSANPFDLFCKMYQNQPTKYAAYLEWDNFAICSASPELFFSKEKDIISCRPMKGTNARGKIYSEDLERRIQLQYSIKNRAENLMITDMIRNDLGMIARPASVRVKQLFEVEKYPSVWQMTSTVTARTDHQISNIFKALFPCASITGAPKIRTMQIINDLESNPRNIYTGSIGFIDPKGRAQFNVAIRTVLVDKEKKEIDFGVGSGVVWDSKALAEFEECRTKTSFLSKHVESFKLLETILWSKAEGYFLLDYHLQRIRQSADYFDFKIDLKGIKEKLSEIEKTFYNSKRIRLLVEKKGEFKIESYQLQNGKNHVNAVIYPYPVDSEDIFLYHKTTLRKIYNRALEFAIKFDSNDAILLNEKDELTESAFANIVLVFGGKKVTPKQSSGLLNGVYRQYLLDQGEISEAILKKSDLQKCDQIFLINSVRKWQRVNLVNGD